MSKNPIMGFFPINVCGFIFLSCFLTFSSSSSSSSSSLADSSNITYVSHVSATKIEPYKWSYIRVWLPPPPSYASASIELASDVDPNEHNGMWRTICFHYGGPPLPDVSDMALDKLVLYYMLNGPIGSISNLQNAEQCYLLQKNMTIKLTSQQITPGVYYIGLFNGLGPIRTQSKMINRGSAYTFSANITVKGCLHPRMWGENCTQEVDHLSLVQSDPDGLGSEGARRYNQNVGSIAYSNRTLCTKNFDQNVYSLAVTEAVEQVRIIAKHIRSSEASYFSSRNSSKFSIMLYARYNAIPDKTLHDYTTDISKDPQVIHLPWAGTWYFSIKTVFKSNLRHEMRKRNIELCYLVEWEVIACQQGKAGPNCTWKQHILQANPTRNFHIPVVYSPISENVSSKSANFHLEPYLSKSSYGDRSDYAWTYFLLNTTNITEGNNIRIQLISDTKLSYELYVRLGGLPSLDMWDYRYLNQTSNEDYSNLLFKLYETSQERINLYILYPTQGLWTIGLRHPVAINNHSSPQTMISILSETCPNQCSGHGSCFYGEDVTESMYYSYCSCDRNHGGFDCSVNLLSQSEQRWHSIFLIASNAAALLPAFKLLQQKACADWVIFMSSGIASAFYHTCDVGSWCALSFKPLQFMDFWLSFWAVVSTFVYLTVLSEAVKRTIHTVAVIITALLAANGATKSTNIVIVLAIGASAFLVGWLIQLSTRYKSFSFQSGSFLTIPERWQTLKAHFHDLRMAIFRHFRWGYVLLGFIAMSMAASSWTKENSQTYWIWHSIWHISIYTAAFFFVCSKAKTQKVDNQEAPAAASYELTRQNSSP